MKFHSALSGNDGKDKKYNVPLHIPHYAGVSLPRRYNNAYEYDLHESTDAAYCVQKTG